MNFKHLESEKKLRGGFYTPLTIAETLSRWALSNGAKRILEPGCGDGAFLKAISSSLDPGLLSSDLSIDAIEILRSEAEKANEVAKKLEKRGVRVSILKGDFLEWITSQPHTNLWDAIIGNPPYIRYQYFDKDQRAFASKIFAQAGVPFSKRTNAWVPFVIGSIIHLAPGGRLAMVLPAEILHILHADGLRRILEQEMEAIDLTDVRQLAFDGVLQGVVLLRAIKKKDRGFRPLSNSNYKQLFLGDEEDITNENPAALHINPLYDIKDLSSIDEVNPHNNSGYRLFRGKWTRALLNKNELRLLRRIETEPWAIPFKMVADVDVGIVTGANSYFVVDVETAKRYELTEISAPMLARSKFISGITYTREDQRRNERDGKPVLFLHFPDKTKDLLPSKMVDYLSLGEEQELHKRYKCRIREPWYRVPYVWPSEISLLKRCHEFSRLVLNVANALSTDTAYRIKMTSEYGGRERDLVFSFLNSLTFLFAELEGRHYAGGVLELVPSEIESLLVPLVTPTNKQFSFADSLIRQGSSVDSLLDFTDPLILGAGTPAPLTADEIQTLRNARKKLRDRRMRV